MTAKNGAETTPRDTLLFRESDVEEVLDIESAIDAVREGFRQAALGDAQSPPWRDVRFAGASQPHGAGPGITQAMAYLTSERVAIVKHFYSFGGPPVAILRLIDTSRGKTLAVMEANYESRMRTGAAGAVAAQYLAKASATKAGVVGTGTQAAAQIEFLAHIRSIEEIRAFSLDPRERQEAFAHRVAATTGIPIVLTRRAEDVVKDVDVLITATPSTEPIVKADWIPEGLHITSMGADDPHKAELAPEVFGKADKVVIDSDKALKTKQFRAAFREGVLPAGRTFPTIGEVIAGTSPGREDDREITIFHSAGTSVQDAEIALAVYRAACERGIGTRICLDRDPSLTAARLAAWIGEIADAVLTSDSPNRRSPKEHEGG